MNATVAEIIQIIREQRQAELDALRAQVKTLEHQCIRKGADPR